MELTLSKKLFLTLGFLFLLLVGATRMFSKKADAEVAYEKGPSYVEIESLEVNLQPEDGMHMFEMRCTVLVSELKQIELFKQHMPEVRSRLILLISRKKPSEISDEAGKKRLQREMVDELRKPFQSSGRQADVKGVFFTSFVID
jgi:flagellar FliL protein